MNKPSIFQSLISLFEQYPTIPFLWGVISLFISGELLDSESVAGYIIGVPVLVFSLISLKELGKMYILTSTLKLFSVGLISIFFGLYLANIVEIGWLSRLIVATCLSIFLAAMVPLYFRFFKS